MLRTFGRFKDLLASTGNTVPLEAFVFVPGGEGPLSWHLSKSDKRRYVHEQWKKAQNPAVLQEFVRFVNPENR